MPREILVVDDDPAIRETLTEILQDDGFSVAGAANGEEALSYLRQRRDDPPGLILLDLMMPVMNGIEFLDSYRSERELPPVPVVVLSANMALSGEKPRRDIMLYLTKPLNVPHLLQTVHLWCA